MPHRTVYRVEDAKRDGPYCKSTPFSWDMSTAHEDDVHPPPQEDGLGEPAGDERCGFASLADLRDWFRGWSGALEAAGYFVVAYRVPERRVRCGRRQLVFRPGKCRPVWSKSPVVVIRGGLRCAP